MQITSMEAFSSINKLFEVHAHKDTQTWTQTLKHMSWRTLNKATVTTAAATHIYMA